MCNRLINVYQLGVNVSKENMNDVDSKWKLISNYIRSILKTRDRDERYYIIRNN